MNETGGQAVWTDSNNRRHKADGRVEGARDRVVPTFTMPKVQRRQKRGFRFEERKAIGDYSDYMVLHLEVCRTPVILQINDSHHSAKYNIPVLLLLYLRLLVCTDLLRR